MTRLARPGRKIGLAITALLIGVIQIGIGITVLIRPALLAWDQHWLRWAGGIFLIMAGLLSTYLGSRRFLGTMVVWLPKGNLQPQNEPGAARGPKIVVIGGGTGLGTILRGLKQISSNLTAIVTVSDDGGSSGRLRQDFGILPPGDIRNCLVALADLEPLMQQLMQYRFSGGSGLAGHSFGNLFLAALTGITGDFEAAIKESSKVLAVRGRVLPATLTHVVLKAELSDGSSISGESKISKAGLPIKRVHLEPSNSRPVAEALQAIAAADLIILGPGSLYTSIIPNLLVGEIAVALRNAPGLKIYVCNVMTQPGETTNYSASDHLQAIIDHAGPGLVELAVVNIEPVAPQILKRYREEKAAPVVADFDRIRELGVIPLGAAIITQAAPIRHDALKLARMVNHLLRARRFSIWLGRPLLRRLSRVFKSFAGIWF